MQTLEMLNFTENSERNIHFYHGFNECEEIKFHIEYALKLDKPCELELGKETCKYCLQIQEKYSKPRSRYCFAVYDVDREVPGMIATMESEFSLLPALIDAMDRSGKDITDKTLTIDRKGYTKNSKFFAEVLKKPLGTIPGNNLSSKDLRENVINFFQNNKK